MSKSKIPYVDWSWGICDGCTHSGMRGCDNCWARSMAKRIWKDRQFSEIRYYPDKLNEVVNIHNPMYVFVSPRGDLFHPVIPESFRVAAFYTMAYTASHHRYVVLTKRYIEMHDFMNRHHEFVKDNIFLGHSISTQDDANKMLPYLIDTPAGKRMVSLEPMLEYINLWHDFGQGVGDLPIDHLDWVVSGCESGTSRRHVDIDVFRDLRNQCKSSTTKYVNGVPLFIKQAEIAGKVVHMPSIDGKVWDEKPY